MRFPRPFILASSIIAVAFSAGAATNETSSAIARTADFIKTFPKMGDLVGTMRKKSDRAYLLKLLGKKGALPIKVDSFGVDWLALSIESDTVRIEVKDLKRRLFTLNGRPFSYDAMDSAEVIAKKIERLSSSNAWRFAVPEARAAWYFKAVTIAISVAGLVLPVEYSCLSNGGEFGACTYVSFAWPLITLSELENVLRKRAQLLRAPTAYVLRDLTCPEGDEPLKAVVLDSVERPLTIFVQRGPNEGIDVQFVSETGVRQRLNLKKNWIENTDGTPVLEQVLTEPMQRELIIRGVKQIYEACADGDSKTALAQYLEARKGAAKIAPRVSHGGVEIRQIQSIKPPEPSKKD